MKKIMIKQNGIIGNREYDIRKEDIEMELEFITNTTIKKEEVDYITIGRLYIKDYKSDLELYFEAYNYDITPKKLDDGRLQILYNGNYLDTSEVRALLKEKISNNDNLNRSKELLLLMNTDLNDFWTEICKFKLVELEYDLYEDATDYEAESPLIPMTFVSGNIFGNEIEEKNINIETLRQ